LKLSSMPISDRAAWFAPARGRGLKPSSRWRNTPGSKFAPARGRGLKQVALGHKMRVVCSPPRGGVD